MVSKSFTPNTFYLTYEILSAIIDKVYEILKMYNNSNSTAIVYEFTVKL